MFSSYRKDQYDDPDSFMVQLGMVLEQYPDEVCRFVTDPRTGIQRRIKWPPTISEIVEACDAHAGHLKRVERFQNWGRSNLMLEGPKQAKPTQAELKEKYGPNYGMEGSVTTPVFVDSQAPSWDKIAAAYSADRLEALLKPRGAQ